MELFRRELVQQFDDRLVVVHRRVLLSSIIEHMFVIVNRGKEKSEQMFGF